MECGRLTDTPVIMVLCEVKLHFYMSVCVQEETER